VHGTIERTERGLTIAHPDDVERQTVVELQPDAAAVDDSGWTWRVDVGPHRRHVARVLIHPVAGHVGSSGLISLDTDDEAAMHVADELAHHRHDRWQERLPSIVSADPRLVVGVRTSLA